MAWDMIGKYVYESGYCVRDAFAKALGRRHPIVSQIEALGPGPEGYTQVRAVVDIYGFEHNLIASQVWRRSFAIGEPVIFFFRYRSWPEEKSHAVFLRDPRILYADPEVAVIGYVILPGETK